jgi:hypothetical protein
VMRVVVAFVAGLLLCLSAPAVAGSGPLAVAYDHGTAGTAVGLRSDGGSVRPPNTPVTTYTTYTTSTSSPRVGSGTGTTRGPAQPSTVEFSLLQPGQVAANTASKFGNLTHASSGIAPYSSQRLMTAGPCGAIKAHHLVEKRFAAVMGRNTADMAAIVVTRAEHEVFTNAWRQAIPYGSRNVTPNMVNNAARDIYRDYPEILQALGLG